MKRRFVRIASITLAATMGCSTVASTGLAAEDKTPESYNISAAAATATELEALANKVFKNVNITGTINISELDSVLDSVIDMMIYKGKLDNDAKKDKEYREKVLKAIVDSVIADAGRTIKSLTSKDYAKYVTVVSSMGYNAKSIPNGDKTLDLLDILYNLDKTKLTTEDKIDILIAYDSGNYFVSETDTNKVTRTYLKTEIAKTTDKNEIPRAILALSPYKSELSKTIDELVEKMSVIYKGTDLDDKTATENNIKVISDTIIALNAYGIDVVNDYRFLDSTTKTLTDKLEGFNTGATDAENVGYGFDSGGTIIYNTKATESGFRALLSESKGRNVNIYSFGNREQADKVIMEIKNLNTSEVILKDSFQIEKGVTTKVSDVLDKLSKDKGIEVVYGTKKENDKDIEDKSVIVKIGSTDSSVNGTWKISVDGKAANGSTTVVNGNSISIQYDSLDTVDRDKDAIIKGYIAQTTALTPSQAIAVLTSGETITDTKKKSLIDTAKSSTTNLGLSGITLDKAGENTLDVGGINFAKKVYDSTTLKSNIEAYALGLITLTNAKYVPVAATNTTSGMVSYLTSIQNTNGSFGTTSDLELTATVLTALAPYRENRSVKAVIDKGLNFIKSEKDTNSVVKYNASSNAISKLIIALTANGIDPKSSEYSVGGKNLVENLLSFKTGGEFSKDRTTTKDQSATAEAVKALIAYENFIKGDAHIYFKSKDLIKPYFESFKDEVNISDWAKKEVEKAREVGIVSGGGDGYVNPKNNITRAEFVKILVGIKGLTPTDGKTSSFNDVKPNEWYTGYIERAYKDKLVTGTDSKNFSPNAFVTREEMATMIYRAYGLKSVTSKVKMSDDKDISSYAKDPIYTIYDNGIMKGVGGTTTSPEFEPQGKSTREMAFATIIRTLEKLEYKL